MNIVDAQKISEKLITLLIKKRDESGITKYKISQLTGISESTLHKIDSRKYVPSLKTITMIADAINIRLSDLFHELEK